MKKKVFSKNIYETVIFLNINIVSEIIKINKNHTLVNYIHNKLIININKKEIPTE